ncbi:MULTISPECIES: hypothetical protein [Cyanophyceae]|uniref:hypothetical protein n=1 Tax=Cyanophyceae TaxID=3028117 RepID=UPI0016823FBC|nr:hypothetical protein [Trichocoleus sp. FACHB-40]MBD2004677.1 hypothetical protein [Trichocoleus sp. FACHB-40]
MGNQPDLISTTITAALFFNPQSPVPNPFDINYHHRLPFPQSPIPNPQSPVPSP